MGDYMNNRIIVSLDADRAGQLWLVALDYIEYQNAAVRVSENEEVAEQLPEYYRFVSEVLVGLLGYELTSDQYDVLREWETELDQIKVQRGTLRVYVSLDRVLHEEDYSHLIKPMKREWARKYPYRPISIILRDKDSRLDAMDIAIDVAVEEDTVQNVLRDLMLILKKRKMKVTHQSVHYY